MIRWAPMVDSVRAEYEKWMCEMNAKHPGVGTECLVKAGHITLEACSTVRREVKA
jgi:hypothetical protein